MFFYYCNLLPNSCIIWAMVWENRLLHTRKQRRRSAAQLISAFVFATQIVQSLYYLNPKFQASSHLLLQYSPVCVRPGWKPRRPVFSQRGSFSLWEMSTSRWRLVCSVVLFFSPLAILRRWFFCNSYLNVTWSRCFMSYHIAYSDVSC